MSPALFSRLLSVLGVEDGEPSLRWSRGGEAIARIVGEKAREEFLRFRSSSRRSFLPHRMYFLRKVGPDARRLAARMAGVRSPNALWEIVLRAEDDALTGIPDRVFFDREIVWHQQHLGMPGHVAYACLAERGDRLYGLNYVSDIAQRISRRPRYRSRVENALSGWPDLVVNAVLHLALERGCTEVRSPSADLVIDHTDPEREVGRELFHRVYDRTVKRTLFAEKRSGWWVADVSRNAERRVPVDRVRHPVPDTTRICVFHDVERGLGHRRTDPEFARRAEGRAPQVLREMLEIERDFGVKTTYNVVGAILPDVRQEIEKDGHGLAFHSFDHGPRGDQLERCREVDYRLRGYRPPGSRKTRELTDRSLGWHNFQWLATSTDRLTDDVPYLENRIVKIPILTDDFRLYSEGIDAERWMRDVLVRVRGRGFSAVGLHDCYGEFWLPIYRDLLDALTSMGDLVTLDDVANEMFLQSSI